MTTKLTTKPSILWQWLRSVRSGVRLQAFGDECWRSLQLVAFFMVAAFLFGAPAMRFDSSESSRVDHSYERPVTAIDASVLADPMQPVSSSLRGADR